MKPHTSFQACTKLFKNRMMDSGACQICGVAHSKNNFHHFNYVQNEKFLENNDLLDPITKEAIYDPVCLPCGHTFSRETIKEHLEAHKYCPVDRSPQSVQSMTVAPLLLRNLLHRLEVSSIHRGLIFPKIF
jgi:hypothetical protein